MKLLLRIILTLLAIVFLLWMINALFKQPEPFAKNSDSAVRLAQGPYKVEKYKATYTDDSRPTQQNNDFAGSDSRVLDTLLHFPKEGANTARPLIIYSHGFTANNQATLGMQRHLASHGYVVAAPNFPLTNMMAPGGPLAVDVGQQPGDVSFLISELLKANQDPGSPLHAKIDAERIGVVGISMGGITSTIVAFHPENFDPRIDVAISIAGPFAYTERKFFEKRQLPFLMIGGDIDALVPYEENARPVLDRVSGATLMTVKNASHTGFADGAVPLRWLGNPDIVGCYMVTKNLTAEDEQDPRWQGLFGPEELGIDYGVGNRLCQETPLPKALNVIRQTEITRLAVRAFMDGVLAGSAEQRELAKQYLYETLPQDAPEVALELSQF